MSLRSPFPAAGPPARNLLLAALPAKTNLRLRDGLLKIPMPFGKVLHEPGRAPRYVYFPIDCMISVIVVLKDGKRHGGLEVGLVGPEGMVGFPLAPLGGKSPLRAMVQGAGSAMRMSAERLAIEIEQDQALRGGLERRAYVSTVTAMQIAACNRAHSLEARLARWLLMVRDRMAMDEFRMTQAFLAQMLGVRRAGVNEAAGALQGRQLIHCRRGTIRIVQPAALRKAACSCYEVIRELEKTPPDRGE
jgi:CRP-like cAMP-binding protein